MASKCSLPTQHQIVAMDHLGAAAEAEDAYDLAGRFAENFRRIGGIVGREPAADFPAVEIADHDGVAAEKFALDPPDAGRQLALAPAPRRDRPRPCCPPASSGSRAKFSAAPP